MGNGHVVLHEQTSCSQLFGHPAALPPKQRLKLLPMTPALAPSLGARLTCSAARLSWKAFSSTASRKLTAALRCWVRVRPGVAWFISCETHVGMRGPLREDSRARTWVNRQEHSGDTWAGAGTGVCREVAHGRK